MYVCHNVEATYWYKEVQAVGLHGRYALPMLEVMSGVPTSTDVAEERKLFEQPFSVFGQPGPRFNENLESIDGRKNRENKNHRNSPNGIANPDSKAARQERQGPWVTVHGGYFQSKFCICVAALVSPAPPLNQCWGCARPNSFLRADKHLQK